MKSRSLGLREIALALVPILIALGVWLSPLAFIPVPWPDDSAFYFVAKDLFHWPPRWLMLAQAPFEPTYRIWNFNTMPLFPILIGVGRVFGIDGSWALKFWSLLPWALSGSLLGVALLRQKLPWALALLIALLVSLNPALRWASVVVRPESWIGLCGMALVLGITLGFPKAVRARGLWDPVAALLAVAAGFHFNAVHLVLPAALGILVLHERPWRRMTQVAGLTTLYLSPWILTVLLRPRIFWYQMTVQFGRLTVGNSWLSSPESAISSVFQQLGSPEPWPQAIRWAGVGTWILILMALTWGMLYPGAQTLTELFWKRLVKAPLPSLGRRDINLLPAAGWVLSSAWLWHTKPEVWFVYYLHLAVATFAGLCLLQFNRRLNFQAMGTVILVSLGLVGVFGFVGVKQAMSLGRSPSWRWSTYEALVDCIDSRLRRLESKLGRPQPFRVWAPTFPDVTVELSRRHTDWELTRTNDFWDRRHLALAHAHDVEAVVIPETLNWAERDIDGPWSEHPEIQSTWMTWRSYYYYELWTEPGWKPDRWLCQKGRWQAFVFMKEAAGLK